MSKPKSLNKYLKSRTDYSHYAQLNRMKSQLAHAERALAEGGAFSALMWANWARGLGFALKFVYRSPRPEKNEMFLQCKAGYLADLVMKCARKAHERVRDNQAHGITMHQKISIIPALKSARESVAGYEQWKRDKKLRSEQAEVLS